MPPPRFRSFEDWQRLILAGFVARAGLSDVSKTGVARTLCAVLAQCLDELSYNAGNLRLAFGVDTAAGPDLDARAKDIVPGTLSRFPAASASTLLTFTRLTGSTAVTIPAGTQVQTADATVFATANDASMDAGVLSVPNVAARALVPGAAGNVAAGALTVFISKPVGVDGVQQPAAALGGQDQESDDAFRQRIYLYVAGLSSGTREALISSVLGATAPDTGDTILYADVVEYPTTRPGYSELYIADAAGTTEGQSTPVASPDVLTASSLGPPPGSAQGGEVKFAAAHKPIDPQAAYALTSSTRGTLAKGTQYNLEPASGVFYLTSAASKGEIFSATYSYRTGIIALAQKIVDGDPQDAKNYPGVRMAGSVVLVRPPQLLLQSVTAQLVTASGHDHSSVVTSATSAINSYLAALPIGGNVIFAKLIAVAMAVAGVTDVLLTSPTADVLVSPDQLVRPGTIRVS